MNVGLSKEQREEFRKAAEPLVRWLNNNCNPHAKAVVTTGCAELLEGIMSVPIEEFITD